MNSVGFPPPCLGLQGFTVRKEAGILFKGVSSNFHLGVAVFIARRKVLLPLEIAGFEPLFPRLFSLVIMDSDSSIS